MRVDRCGVGRLLIVGLLMCQAWPLPLVAVKPPLELEEVADGIYSVRRKFVGSNAAFIINDRDVIVVDTHASPAGARGTLAAIREITDKPVRYVINTPTGIPIISSAIRPISTRFPTRWSSFLIKRHGRISCGWPRSSFPSPCDLSARTWRRPRACC